MKIKTFNQIVNENLSGDFDKKVIEGGNGLESLFNHKYTYTDLVKGNLTDIIRDEYRISEKWFSGFDFAMKVVDEILELSDVKEILNLSEISKDRKQFCAEKIYSKFKNEINLKMKGLKHD